MSTPRDAVQFTRESADRIAGVVRTLELTPASGAALNFEAVQQSKPQSKVFRVGTFDGAWPKNSAKTITFRNQTTTPNTVSATNLLYEIASSGTASTARVCIIGKEGTAWYFVTEELAGCNDGSQRARLLSPSASDSSTLSGVVGGAGVQVLVNDNGCVKWVGLVEKQYVEGIETPAGQIIFKRKKIWTYESSAGSADQYLNTTDCDS